jgi:hypothetical protein
MEAPRIHLQLTKSLMQNVESCIQLAADDVNYLADCFIAGELSMQEVTQLWKFCFIFCEVSCMCCWLFRRNCGSFLLHDVKRGVLCAVSATRIVGPTLFSVAANSEMYIVHVIAMFFENLCIDERNYTFFQERDATRCTRCSLLAALGSLRAPNN